MCSIWIITTVVGKNGSRPLRKETQKSAFVSQSRHSPTTTATGDDASSRTDRQTDSTVTRTSRGLEFALVVAAMPHNPVIPPPTHPSPTPISRVVGEEKLALAELLPGDAVATTPTRQTTSPTTTIINAAVLHNSQAPTVHCQPELLALTTTLVRLIIRDGNRTEPNQNSVSRRG